MHGGDILWVDVAGLEHPHRRSTLGLEVQREGQRYASLRPRRRGMAESGGFRTRVVGSVDLQSLRLGFESATGMSERAQPEEMGFSLRLP